jgi:transcriptional regulator with XRE-family HTH domain
MKSRVAKTTTKPPGGDHMKKELNLEALVKVRGAQNITLDQVAKELGVNRSTYYRIEKGIISLKADQLPKIAKALNIPLAELIKALFSDSNVA